MQLDKLCVACFSPTHTSMKIARAIADGTHIARREEIDLTTDPADTPIAVRNAICIVAAPVYGGLVAPVAVRRIARLRAENSIAIPVVVYGNRDYEDALVQLRDLLYAQGFTPLCGAAFVGEHSYSRPGMPVAEGRPDAADLQKAAAFGAQAYGSLLHQLNLPHPPATDARDFALTYDSPLESLVTAPAMKGNVSYKTLGPSTPQAPVVNGNCYGCGECVDWCPTGAITIRLARKGFSMIGVDISPEMQANSLTKQKRRALVELLKAFPIDITGKRLVSEAIITSGGVKVSEIDPKTMESKLVAGLHFAGEVIDCDAYTGGFNLQIAWATAYAAGMAVG